jgi:hypothetical protein
MFATPMAYLVNDVGIITHDVAVGVEPIQELMLNANALFRQKGRERVTA